LWSLAGGKRFLSSTEIPDTSCGSHSLLFNGYCASFAEGKAAEVCS